MRMSKNGGFGERRGYEITRRETGIQCRDNQQSSKVRGERGKSGIVSRVTTKKDAQ